MQPSRPLFFVADELFNCLTRGTTSTKLSVVVSTAHFRNCVKEVLLRKCVFDCLNGDSNEEMSRIIGTMIDINLIPSIPHRGDDIDCEQLSAPSEALEAVVAFVETQSREFRLAFRNDECDAPPIRRQSGGLSMGSTDTSMDALATQLEEAMSEVADLSAWIEDVGKPALGEVQLLREALTELKSEQRITEDTTLEREAHFAAEHMRLDSSVCLLSEALSAERASVSFSRSVDFGDSTKVRKSGAFTPVIMEDSKTEESSDWNSSEELPGSDPTLVKQVTFLDSQAAALEQELCEVYQTLEETREQKAETERKSQTAISSLTSEILKLTTALGTERSKVRALESDLFNAQSLVAPKERRHTLVFSPVSIPPLARFGSQMSVISAMTPMHYGFCALNEGGFPYLPSSVAATDTLLVRRPMSQRSDSDAEFGEFGDDESEIRSEQSNDTREEDAMEEEDEKEDMIRVVECANCEETKRQCEKDLVELMKQKIELQQALADIQFELRRLKQSKSKRSASGVRGDSDMWGGYFECCEF